MKSFQTQTHYEVLEVSVGASLSEIRGARERLISLYSDDQAALYGLVDPAHSAALRKRLEEAYEILADEDLREIYDEEIGLPPREVKKAAPPPPASAPVRIPTPVTLQVVPNLPPANEESEAPVPAASPARALKSQIPSAPAPVPEPEPVVEPAPPPPSAPSPARAPLPSAPAPLPSAPARVPPPEPASPPPPPPPSAPAPARAPQPSAPAPLPSAPVVAPPPPAQPRPSAGTGWGGSYSWVTPSSQPVVAQPTYTYAVVPPKPVAAPPPVLVVPVPARVLAAPVAEAAPEAPPEPKQLALDVAPGVPSWGARTREPEPVPPPPVPIQEAAPEPVSIAVEPLPPAPPPAPAVEAAPPPSAPAPSPEKPVEEPPVPMMSDDVQVAIVPVRAPSKDHRAEPRPKPYEIPEGVEINGDLLKQVRLAKGLSLVQVADRTRISTRHLENVEGDRYDALPAPVYLRGILMSLARELGLDGLRVSKSYLTFVEAHRSKG